MSEPDDNPIDRVAAVAGEHYLNYAIVVLNEFTGEPEYRFNNKKIAKMFFKEAHKDISDLDDLQGLDIIWDDEEEEVEEEEE